MDDPPGERYCGGVSGYGRTFIYSEKKPVYYENELLAKNYDIIENGS